MTASLWNTRLNQVSGKGTGSRFTRNTWRFLVTVIPCTSQTTRFASRNLWGNRKLLLMAHTWRSVSSAEHSWWEGWCRHKGGYKGSGQKQKLHISLHCTHSFYAQMRDAQNKLFARYNLMFCICKSITWYCNIIENHALDKQSFFPMNNSSQEHFILLLVTSHDLPAYTVPFKEHSI